MKKLFIIFSVLAMSCTKNNQSKVDIILNDSINVNISGLYQIDLDRDNVNDVSFNWTSGYNQTSSSGIFTVSSLNSQTVIHVLPGTQPVCLDSTFMNPYWIRNTYNCSGGANQIRIDSFVATPNLTEAQLHNTFANKIPGDTFLVYRYQQTSAYPPSPYSWSENTHYGFFSNGTGNMLFVVKEKRLGLNMSLNKPFLYFNKIVRVD